MTKRCIAALFALWLMNQAASQEIALSLVQAGMHHVRTSTLGEREYEITTTGNDPYVFTAPIGQALNPSQQHVIEFEYFCSSGLDSFEVFFGPPITEKRKMVGDAMPVSEGWTAYTVDLAKHALWRTGCRVLRFDFGRRANRTIRIRNIRLRPPNAYERKAAAEREERERRDRVLDERLRGYLAQEFPCRVAQVTVNRKTIAVAGVASVQEARLYLCEVPLYAQLLEPQTLAACRKEPLAPGDFRMTLDRLVDEGSRVHDRLLSKWAIAAERNGRWELLSHARYADAVEAKWDLPEAKPKSQKGLAGIHPIPSVIDECGELGVHNITLNVPLAALLRTKPGRDALPHEYNARTYYFSKRQTAAFDAVLRTADRHDIVVSAIILVQKRDHIPDPVLGAALPHPDCDPKGIYAMANVTTPEGVDYYAAALDFLAQRYSRPDKKHGRLTHWIIHNEVDAGWVWTNAGKKSLPLYLDLYHRSMRTAYYIARKYNPHAKVFISLTHHWTKTQPLFYRPREMLGLLAKWCRREGDFEWGIAYHPYPQNLRDPETWLDRQVSFSFDTPLITFKNLEVLDAWVRRPAMLYRGQKLRTVLLSEQGLNSPDYTDESLRLQAAGLAYAWNKVKRLRSIEAFHYHRWADHEREGGLRLGLWTVKKGGLWKPDKKKPAWFLYQACGTPHEAEAAAFAKQIVGVADWSEIMHKGAIE